MRWLTEGSEDVFSSRVSLDALFQAMEKGSNDNADVLVTGYADGTLHLSVHDFFDIGNFSTQHDAHLPVDSKVIRHASHPYSTTHALLVSTLIGAVQRLQFLPLDLRLVSSAGRYLSLLTSKSTQLHNILRYVGQVQKQVYADFKSSQDLPRRFIANLDEALAESHDCTWTQAAFHLLATGHCFGPVREWLSQDIGERVNLCALFVNLREADLVLELQEMGQSRHYRLRDCPSSNSRVPSPGSVADDGAH